MSLTCTSKHYMLGIDKHSDDIVPRLLGELSSIFHIVCCIADQSKR